MAVSWASSTVYFLEIKHLWSHSNRIHMGVALGVIFYLRILWPTLPTLTTLQVGTEGNEKPQESSQPDCLQMVLSRCPQSPPTSTDSLNQTAKNHGARNKKAIKGMIIGLKHNFNLMWAWVLSRKTLFQEWRAQCTWTQTARMRPQNIALPSWF